MTSRGGFGVLKNIVSFEGSGFLGSNKSQPLKSWGWEKVGLVESTNLSEPLPLVRVQPGILRAGDVFKTPQKISPHVAPDPTPEIPKDPKLQGSSVRACRQVTTTPSNDVAWCKKNVHRLD